MANRSTYRRIVRRDNIPRYLRLNQTLNNKILSIGVHAGVRAKLLMIAIVNEFGLKIRVTPKMRGYLGAMGLPLKKTTRFINIPERSFIRGAFKKHNKTINQKARETSDKIILQGVDPRTALNALGITLQGLVREYMTDKKRPKNHPFTLKQKQPKTNPLINTGELRQAVTYKIREEGGGANV